MAQSLPDIEGDLVRMQRVSADRQDLWSTVTADQELSAEADGARAQGKSLEERLTDGSILLWGISSLESDQPQAFGGFVLDQGTPILLFYNPGPNLGPDEALEAGGHAVRTFFETFSNFDLLYFYCPADERDDYDDFLTELGFDEETTDIVRAADPGYIPYLYERETFNAYFGDGEGG